MDFIESVFLFLVILIVLAAVVVGVQALADGPVEGVEEVENENGLEYEKFTVEGIDCIYVQRGFADYSHAGLSCDWSR